MGRYWEALKAGVNAFNEGPDPSEYVIAGKPVRCPHCGEGKFATSRALLNTRGRTAFGVDWADPSATILICAECGRIEWYATEPEAADGPTLVK